MGKKFNIQKYKIQRQNKDAHDVKGACPPLIGQWQPHLSACRPEIHGNQYIIHFAWTSLFYSILHKILIKIETVCSWSLFFKLLVAVWFGSHVKTLAVFNLKKKATKHRIEKKIWKYVLVTEHIVL